MGVAVCLFNYIFAFQCVNFLGSKIPPLTRLQITQPECTDPYSQNSHDRQTKLFTRFTDLSLPPLSHDHTQPSAFSLTRFITDIHRRSLVSIFKHNASSPRLKLLLIRTPR